MYTWEKSDIEQWIRDHAVTRDGLSPQGEHETTEWFSEVDVRRLLADERKRIDPKGEWGDETLDEAWRRGFEHAYAHKTTGPWVEGGTPGEDGDYLVKDKFHGFLTDYYEKGHGWYTDMRITHYARINTSKEGGG